MSTIVRTPSHRNATILFDVSRLRDDPTARAARARFGRGILASHPSFRTPCSAVDEAEAAAMFRPVAKARVKPVMPKWGWIDRMHNEIKDALALAESVRVRQDALWMKLHGIKPIRGGAPIHDEARFVPSEQDLADFHAHGLGDDAEFSTAAG